MSKGVPNDRRMNGPNTKALLEQADLDPQVREVLHTLINHIVTLEQRVMGLRIREANRAKASDAR
jgi:hypothetical protein